MASKSNPKRLRLNNHQTKQFRKNLQKKWSKNQSWFQRFGVHFEILKYSENQRSLNRTWDSTLIGKPTELVYQEGLVIQLFLEKYFYLTFLKAGYSCFRTKFELKKTGVSIEIHLFPLLLKEKTKSLHQISQQIITFRQLFTQLHCNVKIINYFTLLNSHSKYISFRRNHAEKFQLLPYRVKTSNQ
jgi:hypothetical protein